MDADFDWVADTGATSHMTSHRHWIRNYASLCIPVKLADNSIIYSAGMGTVVFNPVVNGKKVRSVELTRVLHVPQLRNNLLACLYLTRHKGFDIHIGRTHMDFKRNGQILFQAPILSNNSAQLNGVTVPIEESANRISTLPLDLNLWHRRFAHHSYADVKKMIQEGLVTGLVLDNQQQPDPICEPCLAGKMHSNPFPSSPSHSLQPLELIHTDLHGPLPVASREGYHYWITFIDDCTRFRAIMMLKKKSDAFNAFRLYKAYAENQLGCKIKSMQDDKGGEYMSTAFIKFTDDCGIFRRHTTRNRPQMNGVAERANRTISDDVTAMITESRLPPSFWSYCLAAHVHVWNRLPTAPLPHTTPFEAWHKKKPDVSHLRVWGCTAYVYVQKDQRKSLQPHMEKCVFLGYPSGYKGWTFFNPTTKKIIISERAEFDERYFPGLSTGPVAKVDLNPPGQLPLPQMANLPDLPDEPPVVIPPGPTPPPSQPPSPSPSPPHSPAPSPPQSPSPPPAPAPPPAAPEPRRSTRVSRPPGEWWKVTHKVHEPGDDDGDDGYEEVQFAGLAAGADPRTYKQAMKGDDRHLWQEATQDEYNALNGNETWEVVDLPPGKKAIGSGWVFKIKFKADGTIERYKARIVAKGYSQRPGIDYTEVFAPTFRPATLRLILALAAIEDMHLRSVDVTSAFPNGDLEEEIYMLQPEGFHQGGPNKVLRLRKSLYGLKQAARQWNKKLHAALVEMGFKRIEADRSVYIYSNGVVKIIVPIYVDDITFASKSNAAIDKAVKELCTRFKCRDLGSTKFLLGVGIGQDKDKKLITLHQHSYGTWYCLIQDNGS
ncbi:hypothetical protein NLJ89_g11528 [Agrocybe chaxingu]|uniref:Integrase catalytic domain-containing protein n=1 Tax=Agrocybe chaxingu TaxID=84603 RepID=A0A9W8JWL9_9AGAR|nr:hypothetical protein NLJ89_g11528 [Agrocybe chaxingu]